MQIPLTSRKVALLFTLAALPFVVGSSCVVIFSSGDRDLTDRPHDRDDQENAIIATGQFAEPQVAGLKFVSGSTSGITNDNGEFLYEPGESVQFSIGDISLGPPVPAKESMSTHDLVMTDTENTNANKTSELNIRRLLKSLDADPASDAITIPAEVQNAAVRSNADVTYAIQYMDFSDNAAFANAASQLVAILTSSYSFTATLLDEESLPPRSVAR